MNKTDLPGREHRRDGATDGGEQLAHVKWTSEDMGSPLRRAPYRSVADCVHHRAIHQRFRTHRTYTATHTSALIAYRAGVAGIKYRGLVLAAPAKNW